MFQNMTPPQKKTPTRVHTCFTLGEGPTMPQMSMFMFGHGYTHRHNEEEGHNDSANHAVEEMVPE